MSISELETLAFSNDSFARRVLLQPSQAPREHEPEDAASVSALQAQSPFTVGQSHHIRVQGDREPSQ